MSGTLDIQFAEHIQGDWLGARVHLYDLDLSRLGGDILRFTPGVMAGSIPASWKGNLYTPLPVEFEGASFSVQGTQARPRFRVSNIGGVATGLVLKYKDLLGATLKQWTTFDRFLDTKTDAVFSDEFFTGINAEAWEVQPGIDPAAGIIAVSGAARLLQSASSTSFLSMAANLPTAAPVGGTQDYRAAITIVSTSGSAMADFESDLNVFQHFRAAIQQGVVTGPLSYAADPTTGAVVTATPTGFTFYLDFTVTYPDNQHYLVLCLKDTAPLASYVDVMNVSLFEKNPDGNPDAHYPPQSYRISRKSHQDNTMIEWELASPIEQQGLMLPRRQVLKHTCTRLYRRYVNGAFLDINNDPYTTCPYQGSVYYRRDGSQTWAPSEDRCGKRLSDCVLRFGRDNVPTYAFPGVQQVKY